MISVADAQRLVIEAVQLQPPTSCSLKEAEGRVLAHPVFSSLQLPLFNNSAMDGYAVVSSDTSQATGLSPVDLDITGVIAAGEDSHCVVSPGEAMQILTGAAVPAGADAVVRQEDVSLIDGKLRLQGEVRLGANIRRAGEEVKQGDLVLPIGTALTPAAIGMLATLGVQQLRVYNQPRVGLLVTGSEIVESGKILEQGQIYDSNSYTLAAALKAIGLKPQYRATCADDRRALAAAIEAGLAACDVLIVTGGVSVGAFDFVKEQSVAAGIEEIFWRVKQKPGKPLYFGATRMRDKLMFGLPGNPASVLVAFYEYVRPALLQAMGAKHPFLPSLTAKLSRSFSKPAGLTHFLKGRIAPGGVVDILGQQGSHMMSTFAEANCLVVVPESCTDLYEGDPVEIHLFTL